MELLDQLALPLQDESGLTLLDHGSIEAVVVAVAAPSLLRATIDYGGPPRKSSGRSWRVYTDIELLKRALRKHKRKEDEELLLLLEQDA